MKLMKLDEDVFAAALAEVKRRFPEDPSRATLVFPSKRNIMFMREALDEHFGGETFFFPPALVTMDQLFTTLFDVNNPGFFPAGQLEAVAILADAIKDVFPGHVYGGRDRKHFLDFYPWGRLLLGAVEEVLVEASQMEDVNEKIFQAFARLGEYHQEYREFIAELPRLCRSFSDRLRQRRRHTRGFRYRSVGQLVEADQLTLPEDQFFFFVNVNVLNACESRLLRHIFSLDRAEILLRSDPAALNCEKSPFYLQKQTLAQLGQPLPAGENSDRHWNHFEDRIAFYSFANVESEMVEVFNILRKIVTSNRGADRLKRIGVVLPDASSLLPFIQGVVSRFDMVAEPIPFNISLGYPFMRTPLYQLIQAVMKLAAGRRKDQVSTGDYLNLIRHPYVKLAGSGGDNQSIEGLRRALHMIEDTINRDNLLYVSGLDLENRIRLALEGAADLDAEERSQILNQLQTVHLTFIPGQFHTLLEWIGFISEILDLLNRHHSSYLFLKDYLQTAYRVLDEMAQFAHKNPDLQIGSTTESLFSIIKHSFSKTTIPFEGSPLEGVQVMGLLEYRGLTFDELIIVDTVEGVLPPHQKYDPLLPNDVRQAFGMRGYADWEALYALNFFSLIGAARKVHLLWTEKDEGTAKFERSRFIERMFFEIFKRGGKQPEIVNPKVHLSLERRDLSRIRKTDAVRSCLEKLTLSPSSLETYFRCPLRFYYSRVLDLEERKVVLRDPDAGQFGSIVHRALEIIFREYAGGGTTDDFPAARIDTVLRQVYGERGFSLDGGVARMRFWVLRDRLESYLSLDFQRMSVGGIGIEGLELPLDLSVPVADLEIPVRFRGRIDRVENEAGRMRIIDYKTGTGYTVSIADGAPDFRLEELSSLEEEVYLHRLGRFQKLNRNFQILLYTMLYSRQTGLDWHSLDAAYIFLKSGETYYQPVFVSGRGKKPLDTETKTGLLENFEANIAELIRDLRSRDCFIANPGDVVYCSYCPFQVPCGNL